MALPMHVAASSVQMSALAKASVVHDAATMACVPSAFASVLFAPFEVALYGRTSGLVTSDHR